LTVTQTGLGHALLVEDQSPDSSPFVVGTTGKVGIGTLTLTSELNVNGKATLGDQILNTNVSNVVKSTSLDGVDAYRSLNIVDSVGVLKIANTTTSSAAALELQTWNSTITTNTGYWDIYTEAGCLAIRDKKQSYNRLTITDTGLTYIGGTLTTGQAAKDYLTLFSGNSLVVEGPSFFNGTINATQIDNAALENGQINNLQKWMC
jgi:hypothetical protein